MVSGGETISGLRRRAHFAALSVIQTSGDRVSWKSPLKVREGIKTFEKLAGATSAPRAIIGYSKYLTVASLSYREG